MPAMMASDAALSSWTYPLASTPVIHLESPVRVAIFPSRLMANFAVIRGAPVVMNLT